MSTERAEASGVLIFPRDNEGLRPDGSGRRLPFEFSEDQLSSENGESESISNILKIVDLLPDADGEWKKKAKESILWFIHCTSFQRLGGKNQLGLITTPNDVFLTNVSQILNAEARNSGIEETFLSQENQNQPQYIGGTRRQHGITTAEYCALAGLKMGLPHKVWLANVFAGGGHDIGQSALSHVGEQTLEIVLKTPQVQEKLRRSAAGGSYSHDHEVRSAEIMRSTEIVRLLADCGVDVDAVADIILGEKFGLGLFDTLAYLEKDSENIAKEKEADVQLFPEGLSEKILNSVRGFNPETGRVIVSEEGVQAISELLFFRLELYRRIYTHPDTLRIEAMIIDNLARMMIDGYISPGEFINNGTDLDILHHVKDLAKRHDDKYGDLVKALDGTALPVVRTFKPSLLLERFGGMNPLEIKNSVVEVLSSEGSEDFPESFYIVMPFDPRTKTVQVQVGESEVNVCLDPNADISAHPYQDRILLVADEQKVSDSDIRRIAETLVEADGNDMVYVFSAEADSYLVLKNSLQRILRTRYSLGEEDITSDRFVDNGSKGSLETTAILRDIEGKEAARIVLSKMGAKRFSGGQAIIVEPYFYNAKLLVKDGVFEQETNTLRELFRTAKFREHDLEET